FPVTFNGPSTRCVSRPIGEVSEICCGMFVPSVESTCDRHLQCVCETAFRQFDLKGILALRLGIAHSYFRRLSKVRWVPSLTDQRGFGFLRTPRFDADAAEGDSSVSNGPAGHPNY